MWKRNVGHRNGRGGGRRVGKMGGGTRSGSGTGKWMMGMVEKVRVGGAGHGRGVWEKDMEEEVEEGVGEGYGKGGWKRSELEVGSKKRYFHEQHNSN